MPIAPSRRLLAVTAAVTVILAAFGPASSASAESINVAFDEPTIEIEYGQDWNLTARVGVNVCTFRCEDTMTFTLLSTGQKIETDTHVKSSYLSSYDFDKPLPVGTHEIAATFDKYSFDGRSRQNAVITVSPAKIAVDLRVDGDPHSRRGAIVSAQLQGTYIELSECYECRRTIIPSGTWDFVINDSSGQQIHTESIATKGKQSRFASFYWLGVPAGSSFTTSATFTPDKAVANTLAITNDKGVEFTSPEAPAPTESDIDVAPVVEVVEPVEPEAPLWTLLVAGGALVSLLLATVILLNVKPRKKKPAAPIGATA